MKDKFTDSERTNYNRDIMKAKNTPSNSLRESDPRVEKVGFLGMDDIDKIRRNKLR